MFRTRDFTNVNQSRTTFSVFFGSLWVGRVAKNLVLRSFIVLTCLNNRLVPIFVAILSHYKHMVTSNTYLSTDTITRQAAKEPKSMALSFFDDFFESWELLIMINRGSWLSLYKLGMDKKGKLNGEQKLLSKSFWKTFMVGTVNYNYWFIRWKHQS